MSNKNRKKTNKNKRTNKTNTYIANAPKIEKNVAKKTEEDKFDLVTKTSNRLVQSFVLIMIGIMLMTISSQCSTGRETFRINEKFVSSNFPKINEEDQKTAVKNLKNHFGIACYEVTDIEEKEINYTFTIDNGDVFQGSITYDGIVDIKH